jgi:hypothetical protein
MLSLLERDDAPEILAKFPQLFEDAPQFLVYKEEDFAGISKRIDELQADLRRFSLSIGWPGSRPPKSSLQTKKRPSR